MKDTKKIQTVGKILLFVFAVSHSNGGWAEAPLSLKESKAPAQEKNISETKTQNLSLQTQNSTPSPSTDFLMMGDQAVLSPAQEIEEPDLSAIESSGEIQISKKAAEKILHKRKKKMKPPVEPVKVKLVVSEVCEDQAAGHSTCTQTFLDKSTAQIDRSEKMNGNELRQMTTITEFDPSNRLKDVKTIYKGVQYIDKKAGTKEFEFLDISYTNHGGPLFKEVLIFDYYKGSGKIKKMTWGQYEQADSLAEPVLTSHAYLTYDEDGAPDKGLAESMEDGMLTAQFLNWNEEKDQAAIQAGRDAWKGWETWIKSRQVSIYLS